MLCYPNAISLLGIVLGCFRLVTSIQLGTVLNPHLSPLTMSMDKKNQNNWIEWRKREVNVIKIIPVITGIGVGRE